MSNIQPATISAILPQSPFKPMADWFKEANKKHMSYLMSEYEVGNGCLLMSRNQLFSTWLNSIDQEKRQTYHCRACKSFIDGIGAMLYIHPETYEVEPFALPPVDENTPKDWVRSYSILREELKRSNSLMIPREDHAKIANWFGSPESIVEGKGHFTHLYAFMPENELRQWLIEYLPEATGFGHTEVKIMLDWFETIEKTDFDAIIKDDVKNNDWDNLELFKQIKTNMRNSSIDRRIYARYNLAKTGLHLLRLRNSSIGQLVTNISNGDSVEVALNKYKKMVDPLYYKRPTKLPTDREFEKSVAFLESKGWDKFLPLRLAMFDELELDWVKPEEAPVAKTGGGVFDRLREKREAKKPADKKTVFNTPSSISIRGFIQDILRGNDQIHGLRYISDYAYVGGISVPVDEGASAIFKDGDSTVYWQYNDCTPWKQTPYYDLGNNPAVDGVAIRKSRQYDNEIVHFIYKAPWVKEIATPIFPDNYVGELYEHRRLLEQFGKQTPMNSDEEGNVLKYENSVVSIVIHANAILEVEFEKSIRRYLITGWK